MTTIAYRDGVLAADTLQTAPGGITSKCATKIGGKNGVLWAATGDAAWCKSFRDWVATGMAGDAPKADEESGGIIFAPGNTIIVFHRNGVEQREGLPFWADGSGQDYALGAMQVGATAEEAVRAAAAWDHHTGGEIMVLRR